MLLKPLFLWDVIDENINNGRLRVLSELRLNSGDHTLFVS